MRQLLFSITLLGGICAVQAQSSPAEWTYSDCLDYAIAHNISLQKSILSQQTADITLEAAKAQWEPTLDFATNQQFSNAPWGEGHKNAYSGSYGLNAGWTVYNGGQRVNTIKRDELDTRISRLSTGAIERSLSTDLLQAYLNILYAKETIEIRSQAAETSKAQAERAKQMMELGRISRVEYAQLNAQAEQDAYELVNAQTTYDTRRMELKKLLELGIDFDFEPANVECSQDIILAPLPPMDESYQLALSTDLELQSLDLELEGTALDRKIAKASGLPSIDLRAGVSTIYGAPGPGFGTQLKQNFGENIGLSVSVPIFNQRKTKTEVAKADVNALNARLDIEQRMTDLAQSVESWYIDTRSAQARYLSAIPQEESAVLSDELTNAQFELGLVNPVELMTAHYNLTDARLTLLQTKYMALLGQKMIEYYRTAKITLN